MTVGVASGAPFCPVEVSLVAGGYLDADVVGYWPLRGDLADHGPHANHLAGAQLGVVDGPFPQSRATRFDGATARVSAQQVSAPSVDLGSGVTFSMWMRSGDVPESDVAADERWAGGLRARAGADTGLGVRIDARPATNGVPVLWMYSDQRADCAANFDAGVAVDDGGWHLVTFTVAGRTMRAYVDGELTRSTRLDGACPLTLPGAGDFTLGALAADNGRFFEGDLADVVLLARALRPLEVQAYFDANRPWGTRLYGAQADFDDVEVFEGESAVEYELLGARPAATQAADLDADVVAYWPFGGGTGAALDDRAPGEERFGAPEPVTGRFGDPGGAIALDGEQDGLALWAGREAVFRDAYTVELWARLVPDQAGTLVSAEVGDAPAGWFITTNGASITWQCVGGEGPREHRVTVAQQADGRWHHIAGVRSGDTCSLWIDGIRRGFAEKAGGLAEDFDDGQWISVGHHFRQQGENRYHFYPLVIDELVVHRVARSADYLYKRAHPLPRARFLATTNPVQDGRHPYRPYGIRSGGHSTTRSALRLADGLLSGRNGWRAWWRTTDDFGDYAIDAAAGRAHGMADVTEIVPSQAGPARLIAGSEYVVEVPYGFTIAHRTDVSLECVATRDDDNEKWCAGMERPGGMQLSLGFDDTPRVILREDAPDRTMIQIRAAAGEYENPLVTAVVRSAPPEGVPRVRLYADGVSQPAVDDGTARDLTSVGRFTLGALYNEDVGVIRRWRGSIASVRLMSRALQPPEQSQTRPTRWRR